MSQLEYLITIYKVKNTFSYWPFWKRRFLYCRSIIFREWHSAFEMEHYILPAIMIWDVLRSYGSAIGNVTCPFCVEEEQSFVLQHTGLWSDGSPNSRYEPRVIYDTSACILLASAVYICPNNHQVPSHHPFLPLFPSFIELQSCWISNRISCSIHLWMKLNDSEWCPTMVNDAQWWWMMPNDGGRWSMTVDDGQWRWMMVSDGEWCSITVDDSQWRWMMVSDGEWCIMMYNDVQWCVMMYNDV